jgi:hypothetical protein
MHRLQSRLTGCKSLSYVHFLPSAVMRWSLPTVDGSSEREISSRQHPDKIFFVWGRLGRPMAN